MSISKESLLSEIREAVAKKKTETGERNAVVRVLAKHGAYKTPKIETGRFGKGSSLRVYIWDTKWGTIVLSSGPSVEGEVQYASKRQLKDAPEGSYHALEKATGTSKIIKSMKAVADRQDVTGSTTVSKPKRKVAPKRKKAAPKKEIVFKAKTRGGKYQIKAEYDGDFYTIREYTSGSASGTRSGIRSMRDLQIKLAEMIGDAEAIDNIKYKPESWGRSFDIAEFEFVKEKRLEAQRVPTEMATAEPEEIEEIRMDARKEWNERLEEVRLTGDTRDADAWRALATRDRQEQVVDPSLGGSRMENLQMQIDAAYSQSPIAAYLSLHPDIVARDAIDDEDFYTFWERTGGTWNIDRSQYGSGLQFDKDLWKMIYDAALTSRPIGVFEQGFNPNEDVETITKEVELIQLKEPRLNKQNDWQDYVRQLDLPEDYYRVPAYVTSVKRMSADEYDEFVESFMENRPWIDEISKRGLSGNDSTYEVPAQYAGKGFYELPEDVRKAWRAEAYELVTEITAPNRSTFYINPQGYSYARYVLFPLDARSTWRPTKTGSHLALVEDIQDKIMDGEITQADLDEMTEGFDQPPRVEATYYYDDQAFTINTGFEPGTLLFYHALGEYRPFIIVRPESSTFRGMKVSTSMYDTQVGGMVPVGSFEGLSLSHTGWVDDNLSASNRIGGEPPIGNQVGFRSYEEVVGDESPLVVLASYQERYQERHKRAVAEKRREEEEARLATEQRGPWFTDVIRKVVEKPDYNTRNYYVRILKKFFATNGVPVSITGRTAFDSYIRPLKNTSFTEEERNTLSELTSGGITSNQFIEYDKFRIANPYVEQVAKIAVDTLKRGQTAKRDPFTGEFTAYGKSLLKAKPKRARAEKKSRFADRFADAGKTLTMNVVDSLTKEGRSYIFLTPSNAAYAIKNILRNEYGFNWSGNDNARNRKRAFIEDGVPVKVWFKQLDSTTGTAIEEFAAIEEDPVLEKEGYIFIPPELDETLLISEEDVPF